MPPIVLVIGDVLIARAHRHYGTGETMLLHIRCRSGLAKFYFGSEEQARQFLGNFGPQIVLRSKTADDKFALDGDVFGELPDREADELVRQYNETWQNAYGSQILEQPATK